MDQEQRLEELNKRTKRIQEAHRNYLIESKINRRLLSTHKCKYCDRDTTRKLCSPCNQNVHTWVRKRKVKLNNRQECKISFIIQKLELANISQEYLFDVNDYEWLCPKCHGKKYKKIGW